MIRMFMEGDRLGIFNLEGGSAETEESLMKNPPEIMRVSGDFCRFFLQLSLCINVKYFVKKVNRKIFRYHAECGDTCAAVWCMCQLSALGTCDFGRYIPDLQSAYQTTLYTSWHWLAVTRTPGSNLTSQEFAAIIHDQIEFEAIKPAHRTLSAIRKPCKNLVVMDAMVITVGMRVTKRS
jgi:hypothetical protein